MRVAEAGDFEPLVPEDRVLGGLREQAHEVQKAAWQLAGFAHPSVRSALGPLLRAMNSYYTNRIEGQHTLPAEIEMAMREDFSANPDLAARQRLAIAHMRTEEWAEQTRGRQRPQTLFDAATILELHRHLYGQLSIEDLRTLDGQIVEAGKLRDKNVRDKNVKVGAHRAPPPESIRILLDHYARRYSELPAGSTFSSVLPARTIAWRGSTRSSMATVERDDCTPTCSSARWS